MTAAHPNTWMPLYWGAYLKNTGHLSTTEHGAYLLLIGHYWTTGEALPDDDEYLRRVVRMTAREWRVSRETLAAFFTVSDGVWTHDRIDEEIENAKKITAKRKARTAAATAARLARNEQRNVTSTKDVTNNVTNDVTFTPTPTPTPTSLRSVDAADDRARDPRWPKVYAEVERLLNLGTPLNGSRIHAWLASGADPELDIYPTIRRLLAKMNGRGPPASLKYFDQAIADAVAERTAPMPNVPPLRPVKDRSNAIRQAFDAFDAYCAGNAGEGQRDRAGIETSLPAPERDSNG